MRRSIADERIYAVVSSWMAKWQIIAVKKFDESTRRTKEASDIVKQIRRAS